MADFVFNVAKGRVNELALLTAANDALIMVPIETSGIVSDATMKDLDTLDAILSGASNQQNTMGRKTLASIAAIVDDTGDTRATDCADVVWTAAGGNAVSALLICYDADTTAGDDTNIIPLCKYDFVVTPAGGDITAQINVAGFFRAS